VEDPRPPRSAAVSDDVAQYETEGN
jgi:hypothetical protein